MSLLWIFCSLLISAIITKSQLCYRPDGSSADFRYAPCMAGQNSMCCRTNDTLDPDTCRPDGLCQSTIDPAFIYRESCTDRQWKAPECLRLCVNGTQADNDMLLTFCADQSICCNYPNPNCCAQGGGVWIQDGTVVTTSPVPTSPSSSSSPPPSSTTSPSPSPTSTSSNSYKLALEISLPILTFVFLFSICLYFYVYHVPKRSHSPLQEPQQGQSQPQDGIEEPYEMDNTLSDGELGNSRNADTRATARLGWRRLGFCF